MNTGVPIPTSVPTTALALPPREPDPAPEDLWAPYTTAGLHVRADHTQHAGHSGPTDREGKS